MIMTADSNGGNPVPAVKGGAVSTLIEHLVEGNNEKLLCEMEVVSLYDVDARTIADRKYGNIKFTWIKVPRLIRMLDFLFFSIMRIIRPKGKAISFKSCFTLLYYIYKANKIVSKTDAEKIVIENNMVLARLMRNKRYKGQWYYHLHNIPRIDAGCREQFQKVTKFICVSQFVADKISQENSAIGQIEKEKTIVLFNCIDTRKFTYIDPSNPKLEKIRNQLGFLKDEKIVIFTGRISAEKGVDKLLEAASGIQQNIKILIIGALLSGYNGKTEFSNSLEKISETMKDRVIFTGFVSQNELPYYYNLATVAVLPSVWEEPAGLTNLEALSCGIPVITTDVGGIPEYAKKAVIIHCDENIVSNLRSNIIEVLSKKEEKKEIDERIEYIRRNYSTDTYIDNFINILKG